MTINFWSKVFLSGLVGWAAGWLMNLSGRELAFPIVLAVALYVWLAVQRQEMVHEERGSSEADPVQTLLKQGPLGEAAAREWLDDFLVRQQR